MAQASDNRITSPRQELRARVLAAAERLLELMDSLDDADAEEDDPGEPDGSEEPSLGWTNLEARFGAKATGFVWNTDLEDEHDGREEEPREPSLGALEYPVVIEQQRSADYTKLISQTVYEGSQTHWGSGGTNDAEDEPERAGIADLDGLAWSERRYV